MGAILVGLGVLIALFLIPRGSIEELEEPTPAISPQADSAPSTTGLAVPTVGYRRAGEVAAPAPREEQPRRTYVEGDPTEDTLNRPGPDAPAEPDTPSASATDSSAR